MMEQNHVLSLGASLVLFQPLPRFSSLRELSKGAMETPGAISKREQSEHSKHWGKARAATCFCSWSEGAPREPNIPHHSSLSARLNPQFLKGFLQGGRYVSREISCTVWAVLSCSRVNAAQQRKKARELWLQDRSKRK